MLQESMGRPPCPGLQLLFSAQDLSKPLKENYCKPGPPRTSPFSDCNSQLTQAGGLDCKIRKDLGQFSGCFLAPSSCVFTAVTGPTSFLETVGWNTNKSLSFYFSGPWHSVCLDLLCSCRPLFLGGSFHLSPIIRVWFLRGSWKCVAGGLLGTWLADCSLSSVCFA